MDYQKIKKKKKEMHEAANNGALDVMEDGFRVPSGRGKWKAMPAFCEYLKKFQEDLDFKVSARGWCYILEGWGVIDKSQFDKAERNINQARKVGLLPVDFVARQKARKFKGVETPDSESPIEVMKSSLEGSLECWKYYTPEWWEDEDYYIQMLVEKIDLVSLFKPILEDYHIPIGTSKGWSSIFQRAQFAKRFKEMEERGKDCVLLYFGDFDPDGLRISSHLKKNLRDLKFIEWDNDDKGYDPSNLTIDRFGLDFDMIENQSLVWVDNLKTSSGSTIAVRTDPNDPYSYRQGTTSNGRPHPNYEMDYVQDYLQKYGVRKCEANAVLKNKEAARESCKEAVEEYLGADARDRFEEKREAVKEVIQDVVDENNLWDVVNRIEVDEDG